MLKPLLILFSLLFFTTTVNSQSLVFQQVNLIDGAGSVQANQDVHIQAGKIIAIKPHQSQKRQSAQYINLKGKTMMPLLVDAHCHVGILKGTQVIPDNYTAENIEHQLLKYLQYGVGSVLSLGTDRKSVIPIREASQLREIPGATLYSAIFGFGSEGIPPNNMGSDVLRPQSVGEAVKDMQNLAKLKPDMVKIWVDGSNKIKPDVYQAIIREAHRYNIKVAAHVYALADARQLVAAGVDVIAHSIRDREIDDELLQQMKRKGVVYIPTLVIDYFQFIYADQPIWTKDRFFQAALEPGVLSMINDTARIGQMKNDPDREKKIAAYQVAVLNLRKIFKAGIKVSMGTDSGAQPLRAQGFSEHLELQLMTEAGLTPLEVMTCATQNGAQLLNINKRTGTLEVGKNADFTILSQDPSKNIQATESIVEVWKNGKRFSGSVE